VGDSFEPLLAVLLPPSWKSGFKPYRGVLRRGLLDPVLPEDSGEGIDPELVEAVVGLRFLSARGLALAGE